MCSTTSISAWITPLPFQLFTPPANVISRIDGQVVTDTPANHRRRGPPRDGASMMCDHDTTRDDLRRRSCCTLGCAMSSTATLSKLPTSLHYSRKLSDSTEAQHTIPSFG